MHCLDTGLVIGLLTGIKQISCGRTYKGICVGYYAKGSIFYFIGVGYIGIVCTCMTPGAEVCLPVFCYGH